MQKLLIFIIIPFLLLCKVEGFSGDKASIFQSLSLLMIRNNRATISGTAVKGIVKNGIVTISPLSSDGSCNTVSVLSSGSTDDTGNYSLTYDKTGGTICVRVSGDPSGKTTVFDEKSNADVFVAPNSNFNLVTILPESRLIGNSRKNTMLSPFSKILGKRLQSLMRQAGVGADPNALYKKASKEIVI